MTNTHHEAHLVAEYETTRTHSLRTITRQTQLLDNALHAMRNGSKDAADEFVSRVLDTLEKEAKYLREREANAVFPK